MTKTDRLLVGLMIGVSVWAVMVIVHAQISMAPANPADLVSPQHQVRQDAAIESLQAAMAMNESALRGRLDRLERTTDGILLALIGLTLGQLYNAQRASAMHNTIRAQGRRGLP